MSKFIRHTNEFVQSLRPKADEVISEKLSKHFDKINELFLESTQYQDNRKKINYTIRFLSGNKIINYFIFKTHILLLQLM